jgi:protein-tyrosine phosphatase
MEDLNFSWVIENRLAGIRGPTGDDDLQFLRRKGISVLVRLAVEDQARVTSEQVTKAGLEDFHVPIADFHAPSAAQIDKIAGFVKERLSENKSVAVSCGEGKGRTGTILMCILISMCNPLEEAVKIMNRANRTVYETAVQHKAIRNYAKKTGKPCKANRDKAAR